MNYPKMKEKIDSIDWNILHHLQHDASLTNQALAERCHLSPPTCLRRVRRLHALGLIEATVCTLNPERIQALAGAGLTAIVEVSLDVQTEEASTAFERRATADTAVQQCYRTSPGPDFVLIITVHDMPAFMAVSQRLFTHDANVRNVRSFFSLRRSKFSTALVLPQEDAPHA